MLSSEERVIRQKEIERRNQAGYDSFFEVDPRNIALIPKKYITEDMCQVAFKVDPNLIRYMPKRYITFNMAIDAIRVNPANAMYVPENCFTLEICNNVAKKSPECIQFFPMRFVSQRMCDEVFDADHNNIKYLPQSKITERICEISFADNPNNIWYFPLQFRTLDRYLGAVKHDYRNLKSVPNDEITQDMCDEAYRQSPRSVWNLIPDKFKTLGMCNSYLELTQNIWDIPSDIRTQAMWDKQFEFMNYNIELVPPKNRTPVMWDIVLKKNPVLLFEIGPLEYRTRELYETLLKTDVDKYAQYVPVSLYDDEMVKLVASELYKLTKENIRVSNQTPLFKLASDRYPSLIKVYSDEIIELTIIKELGLMVENGGTLESICEKYEMSRARIKGICERLQITNPELYEAILDKLKQNSNTWLVVMYDDCDKILKIIESLGSVNGNFLSTEQKVKFAYLYCKYIRNSLEDIYTFACKMDNLKSPDVIKNFFRRVFKYSYLKDVNTLLPEKKTIAFNNKWVAKYNRNDFFKVKGGVPTITHSYGDNKELTLDIGDSVVNVLMSEGIPLNMMIVQTAFREYFNDTLSEFITKLKSYDYVFANSEGKKKN